MAWIESHTHTIRHKKLADLARKLRIRRAHAMGHLHALWHAALEQRDDGDLSEWSDEFIAEQSDVPGDAPQYVRLLLETGFLGYRDASGVIIAGTERLVHDWPDYAGPFLRGRYAKNRRDRLVEIWAKHGRNYGDGGKPTTFQPPPNNQPTSPTNLPTVPTDLPPPAGGAGDGGLGIAELGDPLDTEIRKFIGSHPKLLYSAKAASEMRKLVTAATWGRAKECIDEAVARAAVHPTTYALAVWAGKQSQDRMRQERGGPRTGSLLAPGETGKAFGWNPNE